MTNTTLTSSREAISWSCIRATGAEAESFLQGQLTQDLSNVGGSGVWSLLLSPDSVVVASMFVTRVEEGFALVIESELAQSALARLSRFLLRTDCRLDLEAVVDGPFATIADRVENRWPGSGEFAGQLTPHSFGSAFIRSSISFTKGCFTGQELVGRLDARGSNVPWRFVHAAGSDFETLNDALQSLGPDGPKGLTTWVITPVGVTGLGIVHRSLLTGIDSLASSGIKVEPID
jgi:folate-binding protein YgfZ